MSEKSVIIDGVDVQFCQYFNYINKKCRTCSYTEGIKYTSYKCEDDRNCNYKQLQRAKAEIEELKKQVRNNETAYHTELGTYNMECGNLLEENKNLIEENERLKEENELIKERSKELYTFSATYENDKLKQALQEIREYCEEQNLKADYTACEVIRRIEEVIGGEDET